MACDGGGAGLDGLRRFPHDLGDVYGKLAVKRGDVLNVYLVGSRLWGTATPKSDYDLYVVTKGSGATRNAHFRIPGAEVDAVVVSAAAFQSRLAEGKMQELCCVHAPPACVLVQTTAFAVKVDAAAMHASLVERHDKDWRRAEKLIAGGRLREGQKVLSHSVRGHLLALQMARHGAITDFAAANPAARHLLNMYDTAWAAYDVLLAAKLAALRDAVRQPAADAGEAARFDLDA
eukprot:TRINITY_DN1139_c0_g3_i1.p2 TRINITY_DN1139_c0_g3~~TRINITY_DN1139_c0_g3_i1.p2  ORF type:complete len:263 (+),score=103.59 TRINITY_DN1139_c0_g3_i1:92-790(+)